MERERVYEFRPNRAHRLSLSMNANNIRAIQALTVDGYASAVYDHISVTLTFKLVTLKPNQSMRNIYVSSGLNAFRGLTAIELTIFLWASLADFRL